MAYETETALSLKAQELAIDFLTSFPRAAGQPLTIQVVTGKHDNAHYGDLLVTSADRISVHVEVKAVNHNMVYGFSKNDLNYLPADVLARGFAFEHKVNPRLYATTVVEVARVAASVNQDFERFKQWDQEVAGALNLPLNVLHAITVTDKRHKRPAGFNATYAATPDFTHRTGSERVTIAALTVNGVHPLSCHSNLLPYRNGAVAMFVDIAERSVNVASSGVLLARVGKAISQRGLFYGPGRCDEDTLLARFVDYGAVRFMRADNGQWFPIGGHGNFYAGGREWTGVEAIASVLASPPAQRASAA
jgi:hypothetical protein